MLAVGVDDFLLRNEWASLPTVSKAEIAPLSDFALLDLIENFGLKATVFISASTAKSFPGLVKKVKERGHEIAGHGMRHEDLREIGSSDRVAELISSTLTCLSDVVGKRVEGWKNPGFFQDSVVREGLGRSDVSWCTCAKLPFSIMRLGCNLMPYKDYGGKVELPTAPELVDYDLYIRLGISVNAFEKKWKHFAKDFKSSTLIFTVHPWIELLNRERVTALGHVFELFASTGECVTAGEICRSFNAGRINAGASHQFALRLVSRFCEYARNSFRFPSSSVLRDY